MDAWEGRSSSGGSAGAAFRDRARRGGAPAGFAWSLGLELGALGGASPTPVKEKDDGVDV